MTHTIIWDHADCEHAEDDTHHCLPSGTVTCEDPQCDHRRLPDGADDCDRCRDAEFWLMCQGDCLGAGGGQEHVDTGGLHSTCGHPIVLGPDCNAAVWLNNDDDLSWDCTGGFTDGPIAVVWDCDHYTWEYIKD